MTQNSKKLTPAQQDALTKKRQEIQDRRNKMKEPGPFSLEARAKLMPDRKPSPKKRK